MSEGKFKESMEAAASQCERKAMLMEENYFSTSSASSDDSSLTSSTSDSDDEENSAEENSLELAKITKEILSLPRGLCENPNIFYEFFSLDTWRALPTQVQNHLQQFLPRFTHLLPQQLAAVEQTRTISMLFSDEIKRFGQSPLATLQRQLEEGNCRPDILKLRQNIAKSKRREQRFRQCEHLSQLAKRLFLSRQRLLETAYQSAPDTVLKVAQSSIPQPKPAQLYADNKLSAIRARKRFYFEISQMTQQVGLRNDDLSANENEEDNLTAEELKLELSAARTSEESGENLKPTSNVADRCIYSTLFKRQEDLDDEDACRSQLKSKLSRLCNRNFRECLREHKRRKLTEPTLPEFETSDIRLRDVCARAQVGGNFKRVLSLGKTPGRKPKHNIALASSKDSCSITQSDIPLKNNVKLSEPPALVPIQPLKKSETYQNNTSRTNSISADTALNLPLMSDSGHELCMGDSPLLTPDNEDFSVLDGEVELQQEEVETFAGTCEETIPAFLISNEALPNTPELQQQPANDLTSLNVTANHPLPKLEPISKSLSEVNHTKSVKTCNQKIFVSPTRCANELIQETHASYFSLIRDFFCATPNHRMRYDELKGKIEIWLRNPITALNEWYSLADNWSTLLRSAINFLLGDFIGLPDEYVPYIEFKAQINIYQWIGAGRDSDNRLSSWCKMWIEKRRQQSDRTVPFIQNSELKIENILHKSPIENEDSSGAYDSNGGIIPPPPPPRCPTTWTVRPATSIEVAEFQRQERARFEQPHKAYTYRMHGYESVVGPVKGIYTPMLALTKARGHSMMVGDRPNFVTILTLVRDATARLPNGEGTRADISELLKCSQYINRDAAENVLQTIVSGALDRMHTEHDPCVRYDPKRKIWIYLHRNRSENEFERLHQQNQGLGKPKKLPSRKTKTTPLKIEDSLPEHKITTPNFRDSSNGSSITLPALVPSNPLVNSRLLHKQISPQQQNVALTSKCPPVPPLKYNIPHHSMSPSGQQQQKSLLKITRSSNLPLTAANTATKQYSFQMPQSKGTAGNSESKSNSIILATSQGLQTVQVATNTINSVVTAETNITSSSHQSTAPLTATVGGKRVALNKPIIINQVTQQSSSANQAKQAGKPPQQLVKQAQPIQNRTTLQQHGLIVPINLANAISVGLPEQTNSALNTQAPTPTPSPPNKNFIRLVPASGVKSLISAPTGHIISRQRILTTSNNAGSSSVNNLTRIQHSQQQKTSPDFQIINNKTNSNNIVTISSGSVASAANSSSPSTSIVKMSAQAFSNLHSKNLIGQQHVMIKGNSPQSSVSGSKPQRLILGNTGTILTAAGSQKNIVLQQVPIVSTGGTVANISTAPVPTTTTALNKMQTINAANLTPQQQRVLIQNLKQQQQSINQPQIQIKTVQIVGGKNSQQSQQQQLSTISATCKQNLTIATPQHQQQQTGIAKTLAAVITKDNSAQQQQQQQQRLPSQPTIARIIKTNPQMKNETTNNATNVRVVTNTPTKQIISLENLMQKQSGALRIGASSNPVKVNPNVQARAQTQLYQQQRQPQFTIVSVPQSINNNIITLSGTNMTMGQRIITTQAGQGHAGSSGAVRATPTITTSSVGGRVLTAGAKILTTKALAAHSTSSSPIRIINAAGQTSNFSLANLQGKQVILATTNKPLMTPVKAQLPSSTQEQNANTVVDGHTVRLQQTSNNMAQIISKTGQIIKASPSITSSSTVANTAQLQTVIMGNQVLRVQQMPQIITTNRLTTIGNNKTTEISNKQNNAMANTNTNTATQKTILVSSAGQTLRLQASATAPAATTITNKNIVIQNSNNQQINNNTTGNPKSFVSQQATTPNRVVLAVQGGGQIFLSPTFQNSNLNLKALQNMKFVSVTNSNNSNTKVNNITPATITTSAPATVTNE
uniref:DEUBAD domain-containing protein n=1 Tax=Glossina brevipalpis TaxID=37001 RepID=A0A1A9X1J7_9MUSC